MDRQFFEHLGTLSDDDFAGLRTSQRDSLLLAAQFRVGETDPVTVRVRNLSAGGLMAEYMIALASGTRVSIDVRGIGWVAGRVAWAAEGRIGISFDEPIDPLRARKPVGNGTQTPTYAKGLVSRVR
jgi:hypothetical protein